EMQLRVQELPPVVSAQLQPQRVSRIDQRILGDAKEVFVVIRDGSQPAVFELTRPPQIRQLAPFPGKCPLDRRYDRIGIEQHEEVERDRLESRRAGAVRANRRVAAAENYGGRTEHQERSERRQAISHQDREYPKRREIFP